MIKSSRQPENQGSGSVERGVQRAVRVVLENGKLVDIANYISSYGNLAGARDNDHGLAIITTTRGAACNMREYISGAGQGGIECAGGGESGKEEIIIPCARDDDIPGGIQDEPVKVTHRLLDNATAAKSGIQCPIRIETFEHPSAPPNPPPLRFNLL